MRDERAEVSFSCLRSTIISSYRAPTELCTLKLVGQLLFNGLLDHAGTGKPDQRFRFGQDHIAQHGDTGRDTPERGVGQ